MGIVLRLDAEDARVLQIAAAMAVTLMDEVEYIPPTAPLFGQRDRLAALARRIDHEINRIPAA